MQKRIFGLENEYAAVIKKSNGRYSSDAQHDGMFCEAVLEPEVQRKFFTIPSYNQLPPVSHFWLGSNGARFYFDSPNCVPEYSTPECDSVLETVLQDKAGELFLEAARIAACKLNNNAKGKGRHPEQFDDIRLSKIGTIFTEKAEKEKRGVAAVKSLGFHENYMVEKFLQPSFNFDGADKKTVGERFLNFFIPFLAARLIFHGAGGIRGFGQDYKYVMSQRAFFIIKQYGDETTSHRPFINFKSECAPANYLRLHVICGDPLMSPFACFLKVGTTHLVLRTYEEDRDVSSPVLLSDPVTALMKFSSDYTLKTTVRNELNGLSMTAVEIMEEYLNFVLGKLRGLNEEERKIAGWWQWAVERLRENPETMHRHLDWATKLHWLRKLGYDFSSSKAIAFDFNYSDISGEGIYNKLRKAGKVEKFVSDKEIIHALNNPPQTRAAIRAKYIRHVLDSDLKSWSVDWHYVNSGNMILTDEPFNFQSDELDKFIRSHARKS